MIQGIFRSLLFILISASSLIAQSNTVGLLHSDQNVSEGYTLFTPERNTSVFLIDNCGLIVNEWDFSERPALTCYLLENGDLLRAGKDSLEIRDWDNNLLWSYAMTANGMNQHHDIEPLPNGNILCVVKDIYTPAEMIAAGRDSTLLENSFALDKVVEIQPVGSHDANVVWEWKFMDHLIQEFDDSKENFGVVSMHPELLDINYLNGFLSDYVHVNGIDYNEELDQIMLSTRHTSELHIIDHSTSTEEAAGHSGGNYNQGGDFLWRWGNPLAYQQGDSSDQKLFYQHDCKWVESGYLDENKITVFNNLGDGSETFSSILLLNPSIADSIYEKEDDIFLPLEAEWSWSGTILGDTVFENKKSGVQALPNGNMLFCENSKGQLSEITKTGEVLWVYKNPSGLELSDQFEDPLLVENFIFRGEKYPGDYAGFIGQDLIPSTTIENQNSLSDSCLIINDIKEISETRYQIINPVRNNQIQFTSTIKADRIVLYNVNGKMISERMNFIGNSIPINSHPGIYFIQISFEGLQEVHKVIIAE